MRSTAPTSDVRGVHGRLEHVLAVGRAFLTVTGLAAIYLDPTQPTRLEEVTYGVLMAYAVYSLAALVYVQRATHLTSASGLVLHGLDILWAAVLTFVSEGPLSPFFLFFLFVVLSAAYRWGFVGTLVTTGVTVAVYLAQSLMAGAGPWEHSWLAAIEFELDRTILRVSYLLLTGFLTGYLAEQEKRSRAELAAIADLTGHPRVDLGLGGSVAALSRRLLRTFRAKAAVFVLQDYDTREAFLCRIDQSHLDDERDPPRVELTTAQQAAWLFADPGGVWEAKLDGDKTAQVRVVDPAAWPLRRAVVDLPAAVRGSGSWRRIMGANLGLTNEWRGRVYLFDPARAGTSGEQRLHFLHALVEHVTAPLTNVFLLGRLRARVTAAERARVARELHDGAIQALIGAELKVEALRRRPGGHRDDVEKDLADIQNILRQEVLALRELMNALRPVELDTGDQLPDVIADVVDRFRRDSGIPTRFISTGSTINLPPARALEVVRIVQEALVNIRKHAHARNVLIRLAGTDQGCTLVIEDDGVGFDFEGRFSADELAHKRIGPAIIKERARIAGARLAIDSAPGSGARIELTLEPA